MVFCLLLVQLALSKGDSVQSPSGRLGVPIPAWGRLSLPSLPSCRHICVPPAVGSNIHIPQVAWQCTSTVPMAVPMHSPRGSAHTSHLGLACRLHEALQDLHQMLTRPPIPVNPFPKLTRLFLEYGCHLDLWDNQQVSFIRSTLHNLNKNTQVSRTECQKHVWVSPGLNIHAFRVTGFQQ